ncbi:hypothetical protein GCM10010297_03500 [Streptomyces malachitofuscus]|nr:hypothetical protein GCM10010297_03500 [Streptomyces malachitofuscus]
MVDQAPTGDSTGSVKLVAGLAVAEADDALVITGTPHRQIFRGKAAVNVLPRLLPLLDGTRDESRIRRDSGLSHQQLKKVLSLLDRCGLLDWSVPRSDSPPLAPAVTSYYARVKDSVGHRSTAELTRHLATCRVDVVGDPALALRLTRDLRSSGVGQARCVAEAPDGHRAALTTARTDLVVSVSGLGPSDSTHDAVREAGALGIPVLPVRLGDTHLEIGPYLLPGFSTCVSCLERGRREAGWETAAGATAAPHALHLAAGMASSEVISLLIGSAGMKLVQRTVRWSLEDFAVERCVPVPRPGCPTCGTSAGDDSGAADRTTVEQYEWSLQLPPVFLVAREGGKRALERADSLQAERPRFSSHPRQRLPDAGPPVHGTFGQVESLPPTALSEEHLGELLRRTAGLRRGPEDLPLQRWAPTGGNLASVELYLAMDQGWDGLPGTLFRYDDLEHALMAVRPDSVAVEELLAGTDLAGKGPYPAVVVMVGALARVTAKYEQHAHRLVHLDAGCATAQLGAVAAGYGLDVCLARSWDGTVAGTLCLNEDEQLVTVVAGIRRKDAKERPRATDT